MHVGENPITQLDQQPVRRLVERIFQRGQEGVSRESGQDGGEELIDRVMVARTGGRETCGRLGGFLVQGTRGSEGSSWRARMDVAMRPRESAGPRLEEAPAIDSFDPGQPGWRQKYWNS